MKVEFDVKMTEKIMYNFLLHHAYSSITVIVGNIFGILVAALGVNMWTTDPGKAIMYIILGILMIGYTPCSLHFNAKKQIMASEVFQKPITYTISEQGLSSSQNGVTTEADWDTMMKVTSTAKSIIIYTGKNKATILPKESMGDKYETVVEMISTHVPAKKVKIRS
ncbi:MAG: YcxB family protein [Lachnospiraceae bacterium]|nr:YcxB family protein [Lachnospiraceae bacterium]